jgi:hypothetical protein
MGFKKQMERAYKGLPHQIIPIVVGIETDEEALIFHNESKVPLNLAKVFKDTDEEEMFLKLSDLYEESMPMQMRLDLLPLLMGNIQHIRKVRESNRPIIAMEHNEWIVGVGGGTAFDPLHVPNAAILVGQYNPNLGKVIREALGLINDHLKPGDVFLSLAAASYGRGVYESHAMEDVRYYSRLVREVAHEYYHHLLPRMHSVRGVVNIETQKIKLV